MRWTVVIILPLLTLVRAYMKFYTEQLDCHRKAFGISLNSSGPDSAAILGATKEGGYSENQNCLVTVTVPKEYGILLYLNSVKLYQPELTECFDVLEIVYENNTKKEYCNIGKDTLTTLLSPPNNNEFDIKFVAKKREGKIDIDKYNFAITLTAYHQTCVNDDFDCGNSYCIWGGFKCDGKNNCPEGEDEKCHDEQRKHKTTTIIVLVVVALGLLSLACFVYSTSKCRRTPFTQCLKRRESEAEVAQAYTPPTPTTPEGSDLETVATPPPQVQVKGVNTVSSSKMIATPPPQVQVKGVNTVSSSKMIATTPPQVQVKDINIVSSSKMIATPPPQVQVKGMNAVAPK